MFGDPSLKLFSDFLKHNAKWASKWHQQYENIFSKTKLDMKSKNIVLKSMPLDLWNTSFRMERLQPITKSRGADKCKNMLKKAVTISAKSMKIAPWSLTKKRCLETQPNKSKHIRNMTPESVTKNAMILGVAPPEAPLVAQPASGH